MSWKDHRHVDRESLRVGWWTGDGEIDAGPETAATVANAAVELNNIVASVVTTKPPYRLKRMDDILVAHTRSADRPTPLHGDQEAGS